MAKQPETVDRFQIVAMTSMELVGPALAALTKLGLEDVGYRLITEELRYKGRKVHEVSATEFATAYVEANARFKLADIIAHFREAGREQGAAYYGIKKLVDGNVIAKDGTEYVRVAALTAPARKTKAAKAKTARGQHKPYDVPNHVLISRAIRGRKQFTVVELRSLFKKHKRPEKSISPILSKFAAAKQIKQLEEKGHYAVLPKAVMAKASVNGSGDTAHG